MIRVTPRPRRGQSMVEFALVFPILLTVVFGLFEFGFIMKDLLALNYAVGQAVREGVLMRGNPEGDVQIVGKFLDNSSLDPNLIRFQGQNGTYYGPYFRSGANVTGADSSSVSSTSLPTNFFFYYDNLTPGDKSDDSSTSPASLNSSYIKVNVLYDHHGLIPWPDFAELGQFNMYSSSEQYMAP